MKIGYVRVSTQEQNTIRQEVIMRSLGVDQLYIDRASGKNADRPELRKMLTQAITMEEQVEQNLLALEEWNQATGLHLTEAEARAQLLEFLPTLKRWRAE